MSFYVESASLPGFKRFAEDLVLEPTSMAAASPGRSLCKRSRGSPPFLTLSRPILQRVTRGWADGAVHHTLQGTPR